MKFVDLSKVQDVGTSCILAEIGPFNILIDAGLHPKKLGLEATPDFSRIEDYSLDYIILTHCHLDHLGSLPVVFKNQQQAGILTSVPSMTLAPRMLRNSYQVMRRQSEDEYIPEYPLYNRADINAVESALIPMVYGETRVFEKKGHRLEVTFYSSGHIVGAAGCLIKYKHKTVFITGDVLFDEQYTVPGASFPRGPFDTLIMETTRGATARSIESTRKSEMDRLIETINHTIDRNGSCLIPVFALGRMQELLALFHTARGKGKLRECPIFCSGLGMDLVDYFEIIARKTGLIRFRKKMVTQLRVKPLKRNVSPGVDFKEKGIYLLSSGMLIEHTPSYVVAGALISHPHNSICFVGYCDPDTPGGKLLATHHDEPFVFDVLDYVGKVRAHVDKFDLTGHADREELLEFAMVVNPKSIILTHGDPLAREWFEATLTEKLPDTKIINPLPAKEYTV